MSIQQHPEKSNTFFFYDFEFNLNDTLYNNLDTSNIYVLALQKVLKGEMELTPKLLEMLVGMIHITSRFHNLSLLRYLKNDDKY